MILTCCWCCSLSRCSGKTEGNIVLIWVRGLWGVFNTENDEVDELLIFSYGLFSAKLDFDIVLGGDNPKTNNKKFKKKSYEKKFLTNKCNTR